MGEAVFASGSMGAGLGIVPSDGRIVAPADGKVVVAMKTGAPSRSLAMAEPWLSTNLSSSTSESEDTQRQTENREVS